MSSTKITEFDLDPNMDMAKESSVQEVLNTSQQVLAAVTLGSGGGVKKIQRGTTTAAGTITIEEVVMEKTMVLSVSKGSAGTVATSGTISMNSASVSYKSAHAKRGEYDDRLAGDIAAAYQSYTMTIPAHTGTLSGGTTDLYVKEYSAVLTSPTTLECDGACEWQVIEFC